MVSFLPHFLKGTHGEVHHESLDPHRIPYACHYDSSTLVTKNGELLQIIQIKKFTQTIDEDTPKNLREALRGVISSHINDNNIALWIHIIRDPEEGPSGFSNTLFISFLYNAKKNYGLHIHDIIRSLFISSQKKRHDAYLEASHKNLSAVVNTICSSLSVFETHILHVTHEVDTLISEPLSFLGRILYSQNTPLSPPVMDASEFLAYGSVAFGFDTLEIIHKQKKTFVALLCIKEYNELPVASLVPLLSTPCSYIITQTMNFIKPEKAVKYYKRQHYIAEISKDDSFNKISGLHHIMQHNHGSTEYADSHLSITLSAESLPALNKALEEIVDQLCRLGIVVAREGVRLESIFWGQLPGNFSFLRHLRPISTANAAGFAVPDHI